MTTTPLLSREKKIVFQSIRSKMPVKIWNMCAVHIAPTFQHFSQQLKSCIQRVQGTFIKQKLLYIVM